MTETEALEEAIAEGPKKREFPETPEEARTRLLVELEFVQCLANPAYLHCT